MNSKIFLAIIIFVLNGLQAVVAQDEPVTIRVRPKEIKDVLNNPGIGFTTFQRFNGDTLNAGYRWTEGYPIEYQKFNGDLTNKGYPQTTIAYFRVDWAFVEPAPLKYNWEMIDKALLTAAERGQTLMLRIAPYEQGEQDVPGWYRKMVGSSAKVLSDKWRVDPEDPRYLQYFGGLIRALGQRYDGHPYLESVDISFVGYWGEGDGSHLLTDQTRIALINCYLDNFKKTVLTFQPLNGDAPDPGVLVKGTRIEASWPDGTNNGVGPQMRPVGYRCDCLGDITTEIWKEKQWSHMADIYPKDIVKSGMSEVWKKRPVTMEICYTFLQWLHRFKYDEKTIEFIFNEALKWHISSFNAKSSAVPEVWRPLVDKWLTKMGYRFVLRKLEYPSVVKRNAAFAFNSLWENVGVAPVYREYSLMVRLQNERKTILIPVAADLLTWLPGDIVHEENLFIPFDAAIGNYQLDIAIVSPVSYQPAVKLAIEGIQKDGWYNMGSITIRD
ncbi:MAG: DUF4832 domain-containing protein [Chitinophagaceae bacterium]|nr:DUF4832 domain-containing protein [Chitinophagaceae bacterium]MCW5925694.1 DUF4832 domain-containing protein [Chitinophagaceae bacterium]